MVVQAGGVYYRGVISIIQIAPNKAVLVMPDAQVTVPIFCPIQAIGSVGFPESRPDEAGAADTGNAEADAKKQPARPAQKKQKR